MEQQQDKQLDIVLTRDGELKLSALPKEMTSDQFILVQRITDIAQERSNTAQRIQERMQEGQTTIGVCAAIAVFMIGFVACYGLTAWLSAELKQVELLNQGYTTDVR